MSADSKADGRVKDLFMSGELVGGETDDEILSRLDRWTHQQLQSLKGHVTVTITHPEHATDVYRLYLKGFNRRPFLEVRDNYYFQRMTDAKPLGVTISIE